jgi:hypothetical protein
VITLCVQLKTTYSLNCVGTAITIKLCGCSPQANYTNLLQVEGVAWSVQQIPTAVNLGFLDQAITITVTLFSQHKLSCKV